MLAFINAKGGTNSEPPDEKKSKLAETKPYDRDDKRKVKTEWFQQFEWLSLDKENHTFTCKICLEGKKVNIFTSGKGANKPKKDDFVKHEASKDHRYIPCSLSDSFFFHFFLKIK